jgi:hypothetical protein
LSQDPNFRSLYGPVIKTSNIAKLVAALAVFMVCSTDVAHAQEVAARAWALTDIRSGGVLAGENASARLPMASSPCKRRTSSEEATVSEEAAAEASLWERVWYTVEGAWKG